MQYSVRSIIYTSSAKCKHILAPFKIYYSNKQIDSLPLPHKMRTLFFNLLAVSHHTVPAQLIMTVQHNVHGMREQKKSKSTPADQSSRKTHQAAARSRVYIINEGAR